MTVELVYETHSITEDNEQGIATGWLPRAALRAGTPPRGRSWESDVPQTDSRPSTPRTSRVRSRRPSWPTAAATCPLRVDARLRECDYGRLNGCPVTDLERVAARPRRRALPGRGQSYRDVVDATADFLDDVRRDHDGERVLVIAHSANRWALQHLLDGTPLEQLVSAPFGWQPGWEWTLT